mmetsp:Transcript_1391/g.4210  ORF Transcript_1391/g.4210 Transcript_1391/m.4210 type:complete len:200 (-) Transcript_1391:440-1039(-)
MDLGLQPLVRGAALIASTRRKADLAAQQRPLDLLGAGIGGHDDHGVLEGNLAALGVREVAVFKDLEHEVENVWMRLLDLVEKHEAVGLSPDAVRELTLLVITHIAWRAADELGDRVALHELAHVQADHRVVAAVVRLRQRLAQLRLANTRRAAKYEGGQGPVRIREAGPRSPDSLGDGYHGLILADDAPVQDILELHEP